MGKLNKKRVEHIIKHILNDIHGKIESNFEVKEKIPQIRKFLDTDIQK